MENYMILIDDEIEKIWDAVQKAQLIFHPIYAPEGYFSIVDFQKKKQEKPFMLILDRNIFSGLLHLCKEGTLNDKREMQMIGIIMTWADLNGISVTAGPAVMEYATNAQTQEGALIEIKMFQEIMEMIPGQIWLEVARGRETIPKCIFSGRKAEEITVDFAKGCEYYYLAYASIIHLVILLRSNKKPYEKMMNFLEWSYDNVTISNFIMVYAVLYLTNQEHVSAPKKAFSKDINKVLSGCKNQAWDLTYISNLSYLYAHSQNYSEDFLFATNDIMLKIIYINGMDVTRLEGLIYTLFGDENGGLICSYIAKRQENRKKPKHEDEVAYYEKLIKKEIQQLESITDYE